MERFRAARFGAPLIAALSVLVSACTAAAGAGVPGAPVETTLDGAVPSTTVTTVPATTPATPGPGDTGAADSFDLPDITARPITVEDLAAMLPDGGADGVRTRTNEDLVTTAVMDRSDEVDDIARYGRLTGITASYPSDSGTAYVWIDLFDTPDGAAGWVTDSAGDIVKHVGGSHQATIDLASAAEYPVEVGQEAIGLILGLGGDAGTETVVMFHIGRIAVFASIVGPGDADLRVPVQYLAEEVAAGVLARLTGASPAAPASGDPDSYDFSFERKVTIDGTTWISTAEGTVDGDAVSCRATLELPSLRTEADLVLADESVWVRRGAGDYLRLGTAGALDRQMLTLCPAWPVDIAAAGLDGALTGTPATHDIDGVAALGYRGSAAELERAVGIDPDAVTIEVFNLWIAAGTPWLIEIDLTLTGETGMLTQLIGTGFPEGASATVTVSQRVSALGQAGRVIPPG